MCFSDLQNNHLEMVKGKMFGGSSSVSEALYLNNNQLTCLPSDMLDGVSIDQVMLDYNLLDAYPKFSVPNFISM